MCVRDAVRKMIMANGRTMYSLSKEMGYKNDSTVRNIIGKKNITLKTIERFCDILGYDIYIVSKNDHSFDKAFKLEYKEDYEEDEGYWD